MKITIAHIDEADFELGFSLKIEDAGRVWFVASTSPLTGEPLYHLDDCFKVIQWYLTTDIDHLLTPRGS